MTQIEAEILAALKERLEEAEKVIRKCASYCSPSALAYLSKYLE